MAKPTVGRILWYRAAVNDPGGNHGGAPLAAIVTRVNSDMTVNLSICDPYWGTWNRVDVLLIQDGASTKDLRSWAEWPTRE
jgi:hypothetical protein